MWTRETIRALWLIAKYRPVMRCPLCKGSGGEVRGYYEPEWSECHCEPFWGPIAEAKEEWEWFVGRLPLWWWVRAKIAMRFGLIVCGIPRVRDVLRCVTGWHEWHKDETLGEEYLCITCYRSGRRRGWRIMEVGNVDT